MSNIQESPNEIETVPLRSWDNGKYRSDKSVIAEILNRAKDGHRNYVVVTEPHKNINLTGSIALLPTTITKYECRYHRREIPDNFYEMIHPVSKNLEVWLRELLAITFGDKVIKDFPSYKLEWIRTPGDFPPKYTANKLDPNIRDSLDGIIKIGDIVGYISKFFNPDTNMKYSAIDYGVVEKITLKKVHIRSFRWNQIDMVMGSQCTIMNTPDSRLDYFMELKLARQDEEVTVKIL